MRISDWSSDVCSSDLSIAGQFALGRLIRRLQCFGFHLATLDLRQDSAIHDAALAALLQQPDYAEREPAERAPTLHSLIAGAPVDRKSTRRNSSHECAHRMPSSA